MGAARGALNYRTGRPAQAPARLRPPSRVGAASFLMLPCGLRWDQWWPQRLLGMPEYRIYTVRHDGHLVAGEDIVCANDQEATERARQAAKYHDVELWDGGRFIVRVLHAG
jgi:hypothetical protein